jgi:hypothetical protein
MHPIGSRNNHRLRDLRTPRPSSVVWSACVVRIGFRKSFDLLALAAPDCSIQTADADGTSLLAPLACRSPRSTSQLRASTPLPTMSLQEEKSTGGPLFHSSSLEESFLRATSPHSSSHSFASPPASSSGCCSRYCGKCCAIFPWQHIQESLGLAALDSADSWRVYTRFLSLALAGSTFLTLMLLFAFTRFFDYDGAVALLALTFCVHFVITLVGLLASRRPHFATASDASHHPSTLIPPFPRLLFAFKWSALSPLSLLCFFLAVFMLGAMFGWLEFDTELTLSSRRQFTSVFLLLCNGLFSLTIQCAAFFTATSWQKADERQDAATDYGWEQQQEEAARRFSQSGTRLDQEEA